jgi:hypothetical protein
MQERRGRRQEVAENEKKIGGVMDSPKLVDWCNEAVVARRGGVCIPGTKRLAGGFPKRRTHLWLDLAGQATNCRQTVWMTVNA